MIATIRILELFHKLFFVQFSQKKNLLIYFFDELVICHSYNRELNVANSIANNKKIYSK